MKIAEALQTDRKHCGKRRNCSLRAISFFSVSVFKRLLLQTRKNQGLFWIEGKFLFLCDMLYGLRSVPYEFSPRIALSLSVHTEMELDCYLKTSISFFMSHYCFFQCQMYFYYPFKDPNSSHQKVFLYYIGLHAGHGEWLEYSQV